VRAGAYRRRFAQRGDRGHVEILRSHANGWQLEVGPDEHEDPRVHWHESGTRNMPARPASVLSRQAEGRMGEVLDWVVRQGEPR
jgi:hypothetical protein